MNMPLSIEANERLYDALAQAIDAAGPDQESLLLTKLVLLLANQIGDEPAVNQALALAAKQIDAQLTGSAATPATR